MKLLFRFAIAALALTAGCSKTSLPSEDSAVQPVPSTGATPVAGQGTKESDWKAIQEIEAQAKKLAHLEGCASSADCRAAPVGSRACGGPRYYLAWCAKTTDSVALYRKLDEVAAAERAYNQKYQLASTCDFRMPPVVASSGGSCVAQ